LACLQKMFCLLHVASYMLPLLWNGCRKYHCWWAWIWHILVLNWIRSAKEMH